MRCVTEDAGIDDRRHRTSALPRQVGGCQHDAALIYAADKLSKARELRIDARAGFETV